MDRPNQVIADFSKNADYPLVKPGIDLTKWQHDLFHADLTPYREEETDGCKIND